MKRQILSALFFSSASLLTLSPAFAQGVEGECMVDADCPSSYTCEEIGGYDCAVPACAPDMECPPVEDCESGVIMGCVAPPPAQCDPAAANACDDGLVCVTYTFEQCSGGGSVDPGVPCSVDPDGNTDCPDYEGMPVEEPSCVSESESYCVPPYFAPCQADADCGAGFSCVAQEICDVACSGSVGAPDGPVTCVVDEDGNERCSEPTPADCVETCAPSDHQYCKLNEVTCETDADCGAGLSCEDVSAYIGATPTPDVPPCDPDEGDCAEIEPQPETQPVPVNYCLPPNWERWVGYDGYGYPGGEGVADYDTAVPGSPESAGGNGSNDGGTWTIVDKQAPTRNNADGDSNDVTAEPAAGGCQTAPGSAPGGAGLGLLAALGMMLGLRRRRS